MKTRRFGFRFLIRIIAVLIFLGLTTQVGSAIANPSSSNPNILAFSSSSNPSRALRLSALIAQAQVQGSVRVIVGLRVPFRPEGQLHDPQAIQSQRRAIDQAQAAWLNEIANLSIKRIKKFAFIPDVVLEVDATALATLAASPNVASITEDRLRRPTLAISVPLIGAPNAWALGYTGANQVVAILDSGVDKTHPFLASRVVSEACYSTTAPTDTATSLCPGGVAQSTDAGSGLNCTVNNECIHGTHVAGIAAGRDNGSIGFSGVAKDANIISIQIFSYIANCNCLEAYDSDILSGLERVQVLSATYPIASVNLSLGGETWTSQSDCDAAYPDYQDMIANLRSLGIATVIAAGNDGATHAIEAPGCVSGAISVGATEDGRWGTSVDVVSSFSDSAAFLSLLAPGEYINSSVPGGGYEILSGTSMATPHVTGAWAVLKSARPTATVDQVLTALQTTGKLVTDSRNGITTPRIQVDAAVYRLANIQRYLFPIILR